MQIVPASSYFVVEEHLLKYTGNHSSSFSLNTLGVRKPGEVMVEVVKNVTIV